MSPGSDCYGLPKNKGKQRELDEEDCVNEDPIDCPSKNCETSRIGLQVRNWKTHAQNYKYFDNSRYKEAFKSSV